MEGKKGGGAGVRGSVCLCVGMCVCIGCTGVCVCVCEARAGSVDSVNLASLL